MIAIVCFYFESLYCLNAYLLRRIKIYVQDPLVMKKDNDNRSCFLKVSCHTKFRFAEREAQCILGECGPLTFRSISKNVKVIN